MSSTRRPRAVEGVVLVAALIAGTWSVTGSVPASAATASTVWLAGTDGGVFALGDAPFRGSLSGLSPDPPARLCVESRVSAKSAL